MPALVQVPPALVAASTPARPPLPLSARVVRKAQRLASTLRRRGRHVAARAWYALPLVSRGDPRRRVTRFDRYCPRRDHLPGAGEEGYVVVRGEESFHATGSSTLEPHDLARFESALAHLQGGRLLRYPAVFIAAATRVCIGAPAFTLVSSRNEIFFESALHRPEYLEQTGELDRMRPRRVQALPGRFALLGNRSTRAYYHWLLEVLPRLATLERFPELQPLPLLVPDGLAAFHRDSLRLAGIAGPRVRELPPGWWEADQVYFPELPGPTGVPSPHAVAWLRRRFLPPGGTGKPAMRRLYLTRRDATRRRVLNEDELIERLAREGFEVVCPGDLSFAAQIALFAEASVVVAPHGAALANLVFAPRGTTVIELFGDNYLNGCFWALANLRLQHHAFLIGPSTWLDYTIDRRQLERLLRSLGI